MSGTPPTLHQNSQQATFDNNTPATDQPTATDESKTHSRVSPQAEDPYSHQAITAASAELQSLFPSATRQSLRTVYAPNSVNPVPDAVPPTLLPKGHKSSALKEEASAAKHRPHSPLKRPASELDDDDDRGDAIGGDEDGQVTKRASNGRSRDYDGDIEMESRPADTPAPVQKEEEMPDAESVSQVATVSTAGDEAPKEVPTIDEQVGMLVKDQLRSLQEGEEVYIVSQAWLKRIYSRASDSDVKLTEEEEALPLGPIDNSDIVELPAQNDHLRPQGHLNTVAANTATVFSSIWPSGKSTKGKTAEATSEDENGEPMFFPLKRGTLGEEFEAISADMWKKLVSWHGLAKGSPVVKRKVVNSVESSEDDAEFVTNLIIELYPPVFYIHILKGPSSALTHRSLTKSAAPAIAVSRSERFQDFLRRAKKAVGVESSVVRVWKYSPPVKETSRSRSPSPMFGRKKDKAPEATKMEIDMNTFIEAEGERELLTANAAKDQTNSANYNGKSNIVMAGLSMGGHLILEEQYDNGHWESEKTVKAAAKNGFSVKKAAKDFIKRSTPSGSRGTSPTRSVGMMTRGREKRAGGRPIGKCGLQNLGNTCYMNSALQCLRNVEELSRFFLSKTYKGELNPSNPLAHGGKVAQSYAKLLDNIFSPAAPSSYSPIDFKSTIGRFGPSFSGYGQQDTQEFLAFLLDGLHEDLNRIHKKPYIEKPESTDDMVGDDAKIKELADKCWDIYKKRNDSAVADLFGGLYKSTLVCPDCQKVSITFDPFMDLTLPLPIENVWTHEIVFVPFQGRPKRLDIEMDKTKTMGDLREHIAEKVNVPKERIIGSEIYSHKFFKHYEDGKSISEEIGAKDVPVFYELEKTPVNYPFKKYKSVYDAPEEPGDDESIAVPVFSVVKGRNNSSAGFRGMPFYISLTPTEAKNYDIIVRKVAEGYQAWTSSALFKGDEAEPKSEGASENTEMTDGDVIDAPDSDSENVRETESEEGYVSVRMCDKASKTPSTYKSLDPTFEELMEMRIARGKANTIPTAWNMNNSDSNTRLKDRLRPPVYVKPRSLLPPLRALTPEAESEDELIPSAPAPGTPEMQDISDDDDNAVASSNVDPLSFINDTGSMSNSGLLVEKPEPEERTPEPEPEPEKDNISKDPLIRLGEGIICDWTPENYDSIFGGTSEDDVRGYAYWELDRIEKETDPKIEANRRFRMERRQRGIKLDDCLDEFAKPETLSAEDPWYCPRCKEHRRATKTFELWKCPDILVIHLKRFSSSRSFRDKIDALIDFPLTGLDLTKRVGEKRLGEKEGPPLLYDLFAVDNHFGGLGGGHYTAHAINFEDGKWYTFDDSSANEIGNPQKIVTPAAYLLFYRRRSDTALGGPAFEEILRASREASSAENDSKSSLTTTTITAFSPNSSPQSSRSSLDSNRIIDIDPDLDDSDTGMGGRPPLSLPFAGARSSSTLFGNNPPPYSPTAGDNELSVGTNVNFSFGPRENFGEGSTDGDETMNDADYTPAGEVREVALGEDEEEVDEIRTV